MPTRNINLTEHYDQFVLEQVDAGKYKNASEVLRAGLRLLEQQQQMQTEEEKLTLLRKLAADGFRSLDQGQGLNITSEGVLREAISKIGRRDQQSPTGRLADEPASLGGPHPKAPAFPFVSRVCRWLPRNRPSAARQRGPRAAPSARLSILRSGLIVLPSTIDMSFAPPGNNGSGRLFDSALFKLALLIGILLFLLSLVSPDGMQSPERESVRLVFAGDIMLDGVPGEEIAQGRDPFVEFAPLLAEADYAVGNLECVVATVGERVEKPWTFRAHPPASYRS